jgi:uncharacterized membrane protein
MPTPPNGSPNGRAPASPLLARNVEAIAQLEAADRARQTPAERFSDAIARKAVSGWFAGPTLSGSRRGSPGTPGSAIDPFPFSFLTLVVSLEAIFLTLFVLIIQNNLTRQSERRAHLDPRSTCCGAGIDEDGGLLERIAQAGI